MNKLQKAEQRLLLDVWFRKESARVDLKYPHILCMYSSGSIKNITDDSIRQKNYSGTNGRGDVQHYQYGCVRNAQVKDLLHSQCECAGDTQSVHVYCKGIGFDYLGTQGKSDLQLGTCHLHPLPQRICQNCW